MGAEFIGHALPGTFILILALWWLIRLGPHLTRHRKNGPALTQVLPSSSLSLQYMASLVRIRTKCWPIPGLVLQLLSFTLFFREMIASSWHFFHDTYTHVTCYFLFALPGLVEILTWASSRNVDQLSELVPPFFLHLAFAICVGGIGVLFSFHLDGRDSFDVRIHTILYATALAMALVHLAEIAKKSQTLVIARIYTYIVFGFWLISAGVMLEMRGDRNMMTMFVAIWFVVT